MTPPIDVPSELLFIVNQVFEIEQKSNKLNEKNTINRNIDKLKNMFENGLFDSDISLKYSNPIGEKYSETRTDCEASIAGDSTENLQITEVIKPIIHISQYGFTHIVQKGVVIAESIG